MSSIFLPYVNCANYPPFLKKHELYFSQAIIWVKGHPVLKRYEKEQEETRRWQYYENIPQKHWRTMSGWQTKVLNEQAQRYGIPFGGQTIHLPSVVRALHDFLAANARKLTDADDLLLGGGSSPALERYREERAALARLDRLEREGELLPLAETHQMLGRIAAFLRSACERLQRQFGQEAGDILAEALEDALREIDSMFALEEEAP